jgi:hypothetical protein
VSLQLLDPKTSASITRLKQDVDSPGYRTFLIRNVADASITTLIIKVSDAEIGAADASYLASRSVISMAYSRAGSPTTSYLGVSPLAVLAKDSADWEGVLLDGWLQVSQDSFTWSGKVTIGTLAALAEQQMYVRYQRPTYATTTDLSFTLTNNSAVSMTSIVLTASGSDLLSLDDIAYSSSVTVGTLAAGASKTIYLRSATIDTSKLYPAEIDVLTDSSNPVSIGFDAIGLDRFYSTVEEVEQYLQTLDLTDISTDEEIRDLIKVASRDIDRGTRRHFDLQTTTERYDGVGQAKLVVDQYPIVAVQEVQVYNFNNQLITDIKSTDTNFAAELIVDYVDGFITLPPASMPLSSMPYGTMWSWPWSSLSPALLAASQYDYSTRFGIGISNVAVTYTHGFQVPPEPIRRACMKLVVIELLRKRGASDTQGVATESIAGATLTFATRSAQGGSGPYGHFIAELQADVTQVIKDWQAKRLRTI